MNDLLTEARDKIMTKRTEFVDKLIEQSYRGWQLKLMKRFKFIPRLINFHIQITPLPLDPNELIKENIRIMQGNKEKTQGIFKCAHKNHAGQITRISSQFTKKGKQQGIHISNVDRGIVIHNTGKQQALIQASQYYNMTIAQLFPMLIELKCDCKFFIHKAQDFPDQSERCEHGLYFVHYIGGIIQ